MENPEIPAFFYKKEGGASRPAELAFGRFSSFARSDQQSTTREPVNGFAVLRFAPALRVTEPRLRAEWNVIGTRNDLLRLRRGIEQGTGQGLSVPKPRRAPRLGYRVACYREASRLRRSSKRTVCPSTMSSARSILSMARSKVRQCMPLGFAT